MLSKAINLSGGENKSKLEEVMRKYNTSPGLSRGLT